MRDYIDKSLHFLKNCEEACSHPGTAVHAASSVWSCLIGSIEPVLRNVTRDISPVSGQIVKWIVANFTSVHPLSDNLHMCSDSDVIILS